MRAVAIASLLMVSTAAAQPPRSAPAILAEGSLVTWARCAAMARFGERYGRAVCRTTGPATSCSLGDKGSLVVYWDRDNVDLIGDIYLLSTAGEATLLGEMASTASTHAELRLLRGRRQEASSCEITVRGDILTVDWSLTSKPTSR